MTGRGWGVLVLGIALLGILWKGLWQDPRALPSPWVGRAMPHLPKPPGGWASGLTLLHVWATWCTTCQAEYPRWVQFAKRYPNVRLLALRYKSDPLEVKRWEARDGRPYRWSLDDPRGRWGIELGVYGTPETFVIDGRGVIRDRHVGVVDDALIQRWLRRYGQGS